MSDWKIIHGDCLEVMRGIERVDHVITDPPYSKYTHDKTRGAGVAVELEAIGFDALSSELRDGCSSAFHRLCARWCLVWTDAEGITPWVSDLERAGLQHIRVGAWVKQGMAPQFSGDRPGTGFEACVIAHPKGRKRWNGGGHSAVWNHWVASRSGDGEKHHTTQKPISLMLELVELFTDPGDLVLDPFCGSGTTGVACIRLGRRFIGIEKDAKYAQMAHDRLAAEERGLSLRDARAGQTSIFDALGGGK